MFDVGFWEILFILVLALVIVGPERLPSAARKAGFFIGKARRYIEGVRSEVESELDLGEFKRLLHNQKVQIDELQQQVKSSVDEIKADIPDINATVDALNDRSSHSFYDEPVADSKKTLDNNTETSSVTAQAKPAAKNEAPEKDDSAKDTDASK